MKAKKVTTIYKKKLRSFINFIAREIFDSCKKGNRNKYIAFDFNFNTEFVRLNIHIQRKESTADIITSFDIAGSTSDEDIMMYITLYSDKFNQLSYNELNAEIRDFLRHEIEHIGQYLDAPNKAEIYGHAPSKSIVDYLTQPYEVDAFLYGINYKRKYFKTDMIDEINYTLHTYYQISDEHIQYIKEIWFSRLKEILPHTI